jgi:hypothetical protein
MLHGGLVTRPDGDLPLAVRPLGIAITISEFPARSGARGACPMVFAVTALPYQASPEGLAHSTALSHRATDSQTVVIGRQTPERAFKEVFPR